jgi:hypothetical protein
MEWRLGGLVRAFYNYKAYDYAVLDKLWRPSYRRPIDQLPADSEQSNSLPTQVIEGS